MASQGNGPAPSSSLFDSNFSRNRGRNAHGTFDQIEGPFDRNHDRTVHGTLEDIEPDPLPENSPERNSSPPQIPTLSYITVTLLFSINLVNYMDRFTIAGLYLLFFSISTKK